VLVGKVAEERLARLQHVVQALRRAQCICPEPDPGICGKPVGGRASRHYRGCAVVRPRRRRPRPGPPGRGLSACRRPCRRGLRLQLW